MLQSKTHFEQIPLEVVKKIVEEQIQQKEAAEAALRERLQILARDAGEQSERPVAFNVVFLPWILRPEQLSSAQEFTFGHITKSLRGTALEKKRRFRGP